MERRPNPPQERRPVRPSAISAIVTSIASYNSSLAPRPMTSVSGPAARTERSWRAEEEKIEVAPAPQPAATRTITQEDVNAINRVTAPCRELREVPKPVMPPNVPENIAKDYVTYLEAAVVMWGTTLFAPALLAEWFHSRASTKNALQELCQKFLPGTIPTYTSSRVAGQDHIPVFVAQVAIQDYTAVGYGSTIKAAEKCAAHTLMYLFYTAGMTEATE
jgi:hypothetical protein